MLARGTSFGCLVDTAGDTYFGLNLLDLFPRTMVSLGDLLGGLGWATRLLYRGRHDGRLWATRAVVAGAGVRCKSGVEAIKSYVLVQRRRLCRVMSCGWLGSVVVAVYLDVVQDRCVVVALVG